MDVYSWIILPLLIFIARVLDVSLGTVRIILFSKNQKKLVALIGFIEILIWLLAIRQVMTNLSNPMCYLAFAGGFATGNYIGLLIEEKIALGYAVVRIITRKKADDLIASLNERHFGVTQVPAKGSTGDVDIIFTIILRKQINEVKTMVEQFNPQAFYTIEDIKAVSDLNLPLNKKHGFFRGLWKK